MSIFDGPRELCEKCNKRINYWDEYKHDSGDCTKDLLNWKKEYDENHNTVYVLDSPYSDECGCGIFRYKISPIYKFDNVIFYESSDKELLNDLFRRSWETLEDAKNALEKDYKDILKHCKV